MLKAKDIMTTEVITVKPHTTVEELARVLMENHIDGAPVVDDAGNLVGIVTEHDLINQEKRLHIPTVVRIMDAFIYLDSPKKFEEDLKKMVGTKVGDICSPGRHDGGRGGHGLRNCIHDVRKGHTPAAGDEGQEHCRHRGPGGHAQGQ